MDIGDQIIQEKTVLHKLVMEDWLKNDVFSIRWFVTVGLILLSYFIVFKLLDKRRFIQILFFGSLIAVSMTTLDIFGSEFVHWTYLSRVFPIVPSIFFYDYTIYPLYYMLVYQYSSNWKSFAIWDAVLAGIISFGVYPLLTAFKMVKLHNWNYLYFFLIICVWAFLCRGVVWGIMSIQKKMAES
jgi:hypothetical protein